MQKGLPPSGSSSKPLQDSKPTPLYSTKREDNEAQLEILKNMKTFLTDKVKKSDECILILETDVDNLKNLLRVEKAAH